jgi:hypothetical protein
MVYRISYTKHENDLLGHFRNDLNRAESSEDVKKFFDYSMRELFDRVFDGDIKANPEDCSFSRENDNLYVLSQRLLSSELFNTVWESSDLSRIVKRFASAANNRYTRLEKHQEKTEAKIRG